MSRRRGWLLAGLGLGLALLALPFALRWSRTCKEEREGASRAWAAYEQHLDGGRAAAEARRVLETIDRDLPGALERGGGMLATPAPDDLVGAGLYREAMERLVLAEGACHAER